METSRSCFGGVHPGSRAAFGTAWRTCSPGWTARSPVCGLCGLVVAAPAAPSEDHGDGSDGTQSRGRAVQRDLLHVRGRSRLAGNGTCRVAGQYLIGSRMSSRLRACRPTPTSNACCVRSVCGSPDLARRSWRPCRIIRTRTPTRSSSAVRAEFGDVSHQAVYDVLRALTAAGLVRRIQPAGSVARYESRVADNHHHVVCRSCGAIADVDCAVGARSLSHRRRGPRIRDRRGRGCLLGPVPRLPCRWLGPRSHEKKQPTKEKHRRV